MFNLFNFELNLGLEKILNPRHWFSKNHTKDSVNILFIDDKEMPVVDSLKKNGYKVIKSLLIAPEFSDDFIKDCGLDYELNLSLITANSLYKILEGFKESKHVTLPHNLFMRDVLIQEDRIIKAIGK